MTNSSFETLDLNLLKVFVVLAQELNTRRTAERMNVSQPAISRSLQKLREHFADELFVRAQHGLIATPKAEQLSLSLPSILAELANVVDHHNDFDPAKLEGVLKVAMHPMLLASVAKRLFVALQQHAPDLRLQVATWGADTCELIQRGQIDFGLCLLPVEGSKELVQRRLWRQPIYVYARDAHPIGDDIVTPQDFENYATALIHVPGWSAARTEAEKFLAAHGVEVTIGFRSELPGSIMDVLRVSDLVYPSVTYYPPEDIPGIRQLQLSEEFKGLALKYDTGYVFHYRNRQNPLYLWLQEILVEQCRDEIFSIN
ncbi:LysR family transcriptional regulator [Agarivorans sp. B2Z047]|uniref:LysR family transcriptional regulator n=1 Tax=Agarivorans sp. B2Z047 TaxID=2652721 RepID=UPI00128CEC71|nr:LysR family transcriptional regulator [Agarivorans sp. B2Z047]MPW30248.1 LysR family transcriptional regulator [Agarivorans sp. B2Z047]UQN43121.1 LysR family transcriptional regulator [Agarivorans sp. B2Z047]